MYDSPAIDHALQALPEDTAAATRAVLHDVFGYSAFRGPQAEIVTHVADGGDCLVLMPTGAANPSATRSRRLCGTGAARARALLSHR
ncbi:atp-dependent dna helicase domain protein [Ralstonia insidiosa]|uniref:Atp-dependent dna helicase domain protein n=1 Tax=Ralstonia insidiosa TaxID=190721 RepID=A0AAC9BG51_9RALS|nr:atp-dependent dna helicase domain protein [Ralstonia insidiosa]